ncbi:DUF732 domain-containing protein [Mycobacterium sp. ACS4331]|uniref:DUF732 domain-containing protein n=1 Tax=Mycobacterium sp. ACS4331 TaxID=1834121 RepID=UPI000800ED42|nr:DUF732 domain-containing protein [Mycobacterium sp. ACS4331]OBF30152.1 hypothetical protein A5727_22580 [Mycobacterium sp. ACS4331]
MRSRKSVLGGVLTAAAAAAIGLAPSAQADQLGYIINVTTGPGYNFPNAQAALDYGYALCDRIARGDSYVSMADQIKADFGPDEYKVSYLLSQSAQELCPAQTWQLRQSVGDGYRPTT